MTGNPAPSITIDNGVGQVSGSLIVIAPSVTTTYTLTAQNTYGTANAQTSVSVVVNNNNNGYGGSGSATGGGGGGGSASGGSSGGGSSVSVTGSSGSSSPSGIETSGSDSSSSLEALPQTLLQELNALIAKLNAQLVASFTNNLTVGSYGSEVKNLQVFLNDNGYTIASKGPGSPGNESEYFGPITERALAKWQAANNLPATGFFGSMTRAVMEKKW